MLESKIFFLLFLIFIAKTDKLTFFNKDIVIENPWSDKTIEFFKEHVPSSSVFQIRVKSKMIDNESYKIDLIDPKNNQSISDLLVENGLAKKFE